MRIYIYNKLKKKDAHKCLPLPTTPFWPGALDSTIIQSKKIPLCSYKSRELIIFLLLRGDKQEGHFIASTSV